MCFQEALPADQSGKGVRMGKPQKVKTLSINTFLFAMNTLGTKFIAFFLVPLYTHVLSTEEYGKLDLMGVTSQLLVPFLTLNVRDAVLRFTLDKENKPEEVIGIGLKIFGCGSILMLLMTLVITNIEFFPYESRYYWYLYALFVTNALYNILSMYLKAENRVRLLVISGIVNSFITCILSILLLLVWKQGVLGYMTANITGTFISIVLMIMFSGAAKAIGIKTTGKLCKRMTAYSFPLIFSSVALWINSASDRYILTFFCGASVNGIYSVAYKIPIILSSVQDIFYNSWSISAITEFDSTDKDGFISNVYNMYSFISFVGCSVIMLMNIFFARLLYSNDFYQAWQYVPILLLGMVFYGMSLFEGCLFTAVKRTKTISATTLAGAFCNTLLNIILIPYIGAFGAAIATGIGYFIMWLMRTLRLSEFVNLKIDWKCHIITIIFLLFQCIVATKTEKFCSQLIIAVIVVYCQRQNAAKLYHFLRSNIKGIHSI